MLNFRFFFIVFSLGCFTLSPLKALSNELDHIQKQQDKLLKNEQLRLENELNRFDQLTPPSQSTSELDDSKEIADENKNLPCIPFNKIIIEGASLLSETDKFTLLDPYQGKCLSAVKLTALQGDLTNHYVRAGYITTRVYFPNQDFSNGELRIWVLEGKYESLEILERDANSPQKDASVPRSGFNTALRHDPDEILNLRDLEQAIDQINRLGAYDAQMMLEPGKGEGTTNVKLYTKTSKPWSLSSGVNNGGSEVLGEYQSTYSTRFEDVLGLYELWAFSYGRELRENRADRWGRSYTVFLSLPYEYWTLNLVTSLYEYKTPIKGQVLDYTTSGNSRSHSLELKRVVHRDQKGKTQVSGKVSYSEIRTYVEETFIGISSRKAASWSLGIDHSRRWYQGVLSGSLTYERGTPWWDATDRISYDEMTPNPIYSLWRGSSSYFKPFQWLNQNLSWNTSLYAQWAPHTLYNTQRVQIGGQYSVRGFRRKSINGDRGAYWRNDLNWTLPQTYAGVRQQLFIAYDVGGVLYDWREEQERGWMQGAAWGLNLYHKHFNTQMQWEHGLQGPEHAKPDPWIFRLSAMLSY